MNIKRRDTYLSYFNNNTTASWSELNKIVDVSQLTIRRDMKVLSREKIISIENGGIKVNKTSIDTVLDSRKKLNFAAKKLIAKKAANLINDNERVFIDAGSTTELVIPFIKAKNIIIITNALNIAYVGVKNDHEVILLGGRVKGTTLATTEFAIDEQLSQLFFDKSFMGANGACIENGYSTPDIREANVKKKVISKSKKTFILMDDSKFDNATLVSFAKLDQHTLITNKVPNKYIERVNNDI